MKINEILSEGYKTLPPIDMDKYPTLPDLEGPFRLKNGKVVYYDKKEGKHYDKDTDMYIEYDDFIIMNS